jgi:hypothetical protein
VTEGCGNPSDHDWEPLDRDKVEAAYIVTDDGHEVPIVEVGMPTHRCTRCGLVALPRL